MTETTPVRDVKGLTRSLRERGKAGLLNLMDLSLHCDRIDAIMTQVDEILHSTGPLPAYRRYPARTPSALTVVADAFECSGLEIHAARSEWARRARAAVIWLEIHVEHRSRAKIAETFNLSPAAVDDEARRAALRMQTDSDFAALIRAATRIVEDYAGRRADDAGDESNVVRLDTRRAP